MKYLVGLALVLLSACRTVSDTSQSKIINGEKVESSDPIAKSVVVIATKSPDNEFRPTCTASLVARNLLVTAAHCIAAPGEYVAWFGTDPKYRIAEISITKVQMHPNYRGSTSPHAAINNGRDSSMFDIGWVQLAEDAPKGTEILPVLADDEALRGNPSLTIVGGGKTDAACPNNDCTGTLYKLDFKALGIFHNKFLSNLVALESKADQGVCYGDSGGPALLKKEGKTYIAGVAHGTNEDFTGRPLGLDRDSSARFDCKNYRTLYTTLPGYITWIEESAGVKLMRDSSIILAKDLDSESGSPVDNPKTLRELIYATQPGTETYNTILSLYAYAAYWEGLDADEALKLYNNQDYAAKVLGSISSFNMKADSRGDTRFVLTDSKVLNYLPALRHLRISNYLNLEEFYPVLANLSELETLEIQNEVTLPVEDSAKNDYFRKLTKLKVLAINSPRVPFDCKALRYLKSLQSLTLSFCPLYEGDASRYEFLKNFPELETFRYTPYLSRHNPGEQFPGFPMPKLKQLSLYDDVRNITQYVKFEDMPNLTHLDLKFNADLDLTKPLPLPQLKELKLGYSEAFTKELVLAFKEKMPSLETVYISAEKY